MRRALAGISLAALAAIGPHAAGETMPLSYAEAKPILELLRARLPADLASKTAGSLEAEWPRWVERRNAAVRARVEQGDEDSLINFLLFGTTFTKLPRALNDSARLGGRERAGEIVRGRIADLIAGIAKPGTNERLLFARELVRRRGIDPGTRSGQQQLRSYLLSVMRRGVSEVQEFVRALDSARAPGDAAAEFAARSTLFRTRGLSSDTSIRPDFAIDQTLEAMASNGTLAEGSIRRVAIVGPGLDFTDKAEGYDFYPQQTTQPFAVIDSLLRRRLADADTLRLTTFDLSARVNGHLEAALRRARTGDGYRVVLPRDRETAARPAFLSFWNTFGSRIGEETNAPAAPRGSPLDLRAVRIRPGIVLSIDPRDLNIVLERLALPDGDRFDLVVATNVLVYYDVFEQSLALANVAAMLRPGGFLLSNNVLPEVPATPVRSIGSTTAVYSDRPDDTDHVVWYRRE